MLADLAERVAAVQRRFGPVPARADGCGDECGVPVVSTGWDEIDRLLGGGLAAAGLHEWFSPPGAPPLCILAHLAWRALAQQPLPRWTVWIGGRCFPYPRLLTRDMGTERKLLERSLFVAAEDAAARREAVDLSLRCAAIGLVVADGRGFDRVSVRRIHLLARWNGKMALLSRPVRELAEPSAAQGRWRVDWHPAVRAGRPCWRVELLRDRALRDPAAARVWMLEWRDDPGVVGLSAALAVPGRPAAEPADSATAFRNATGSRRGAAGALTA